MVTGKSADGPVKTRRGEFVVGMDGKFPLFWPIKAQSESSLLRQSSFVTLLDEVDISTPLTMDH